MKLIFVIMGSINKINNPYNIFKKLESLTKALFLYTLKLVTRNYFSKSRKIHKKRGNKLISEPIKGTSKRSKDLDIDQQLINSLKNDPKERAENIMIVDLVRNDLSKVANKNSVSCG